MLKAMLDDGANGVAQRALTKAGADCTAIDKKLEEHFNRQPRVYGDNGDNFMLGRTGSACLHAALDIKRDFGDEYVAVDHLLLATRKTDGYTSDLFREMNVSYEALAAAVREIRGANKVTSQAAESNYEALAKYSRDLTKDAADGKLDPVIGRDEEIRRTIQLLSRRNKNNPILIGEPGVGILTTQARNMAC